MLIAVLMFYACAQRVPISGGDKDEQAPRLIKSEPDTFSTGFKSDRIKLEFDEFVNIRNANKNVLITPVLRYQPTVVANGKKVLIRNLDDSLWPNSTYVIEFNEAIIDITENNASKGMRYVFSTGEYVDSLAVMGQAKDAFTLEPLQDVFAFFYLKDEDSIPYLEAPRYMGRTNKQGVFHVRNMKAGTYKVFFCSDENGNYKFDRPSEKIDFLDTLLEVTADTVPRVFANLSKEERSDNFLESYGSLNRWSFYLAYSTPVESITFFNEGSEDLASICRPEFNNARDSVVYWATDTSLFGDTLSFMVQADTGVLDTLTISFPEKEDKSGLKPRNNLLDKVLKLGEDIRLESTYPLIVLDSGKITLYRDTIPIATRIETAKAGRQLIIKAAWKPESNYKLIMDSAALSDLNGRVNDSLVISFNTLKESEYGSLEINIDLIPGDGLLFIMDEGNKVLEEIVLKGVNKHYFPYMEPGKYRLKYIVDENSNEKWDRGNYLKGRHAEKVFIYQGTITVRSNWDQVIEWKIN